MNSRSLCALAIAIALLAPARPAHADTIVVAAGGDLQAALNAARSGDTILLEPQATFTGNFKLPVHGGTDFVTIRSAASDLLLPGAGRRMTPAYAAYLPRIVSPNNGPALRTAVGAAYWRLMLLEIGPTAVSSGTALELGDGGSLQSSLPLVPHHLIVDRVYVHGDPIHGQRRGIGLNSAETTIVNSHIADIKAIGQDSQAIGGWNGPGPFHIENNYLEAAGEGVMFGGDDPRIDQLMPSDIEFRGNTVTRPMAWRNPVLPAPSNVRVSLADPGVLAAGTYAYRVVARRQIGGAWIRSSAAAEVAVVAGGDSAVRIQWDPVPGAVDYDVYGRTPGAQNRYWRTTAAVLLDNGLSGGTAGTAPSSLGTRWQVKNLFELKNARRVHIAYNTFENNWEQAQAGTAILFTSRNQYGRCLWCRVEDVVFEHNIVRRTGGAIQILGWDDERPSAQANNITIRHNQFSDFGKSYGGNGYFVYVIDQPLNVTVDHNTIVSNDGAGVIMADKRAAINFVFTNNVMRHNTYGIFGSGYSAGLTTIARYFPDGRFERNVLAGGSAAKYPAGNLFPTVAAFESHFVDHAGGDFALVPGADWAQAGTDGEDLGANINALRVLDGDIGGDPLVISTSSLPGAIEGQAYSATAAAVGGVPDYSWKAIAGQLPSGLLLETATGEVHGIAAAWGDFTLTLTVTDSWGDAVSQPVTLHVARAIDPVEIVTPVLAGGIATVPYSQALDATGGLGEYVWSLAGGTLPAGLSLSANGVLSGTPLQQVTTVIVLDAVDAADGQRRASRTFSLMIAAPPNQLPSVSLTAPLPAAAVPVGSTATLAASASDADGYVVRVDFLVNGEPVGSAAPGVPLPWLVPAPGTYSIVAIAVDDAGAAVESAAVAITTRSEVVVYASEVATMAGNYELKADPGAAGGYALRNPNRAAARVNVAATDPASVAEFTFFAEAGRPYQLWVRGRAEWNDPANDSVHVQFDGVAAARIGSADSLTVNLEETVLVGIAGWGWQDNGYGAGVLGAPVVFEQTGRQTLRLQPREDGFLIDQIVLSPELYRSSAPGAPKNDGTMIAR